MIGNEISLGSCKCILTLCRTSNKIGTGWQWVWGNIQKQVKFQAICPHYWILMYNNK
jgi:hypothetical protein